MKLGKLLVALIAAAGVGGAGWFIGRQGITWEQLRGKKCAISLSDISPEKLPKEGQLVALAVVGSGPAGLSAAIYGARFNLHTLVFTGKEPGGQLTTTTAVENWPGFVSELGPTLMKRTEDQARACGAHIVRDSVVSIDTTRWPYHIKTEEGREFDAMAVVIATGSTPKKLGIPGENEYWAKGVSACAVCDGPFFKGKKVAVVGGGDSSIEMATALAAYASSVELLVRSDKMRASTAMQKRLPAYQNVKVVYNCIVEKVVGNETHVTGLDVVINGDKQHKELDGFFLAIGHVPNSSLVSSAVACDAMGYIDVEYRTQKTCVPGIMAAGDVADSHYRQAGIAAGEGIKAGLDAVYMLQKQGFTPAVYQSLADRYYYPDEETVQGELTLVKTKQAFDEALAAAGDKPVIIDVYAPYCPSCMKMLPVISYAAGVFKDKAVFIKIDSAASPELAKQLQVTAIPHLIIMRKGETLARTQELFSKAAIRSFISKTCAI
jgi:thioredoxin reductase (NADPH)